MGANASSVSQLGLSLVLLASVVTFTLIFLYRQELAGGSLKRRIPFFEFGWTRDSK